MLGFLSPIIAAARKPRNRLFNLFDPPVVVLIYHRVTKLPSDPQLLAVSPDNFRSHLQYLKKNFPIVRFEDDWSKLREPSIAITFDDGYADNAREALPIIEEIGIPVSFFISTGTIETNKRFWWDDLEYIISGKWLFPKYFELIDKVYGRVWQTATPLDRLTLYNEIHPLMKKVNSECKDGWLNQLHAWVNAPRCDSENNRTMTLYELRSLDKSTWVTVGAHSVTHSCLSSLSREEQREEILSSKTQLESWLGHKINIFSYPFGSKIDYNQSTVNICREAGFMKAAANFPGQAHRWSDPYQIPRHIVRNWTIDIFAAKLNGFWIL
jgi:peptidoglycan/xylan/chitin deacetylase (PgdA/CDA1 family)